MGALVNNALMKKHLLTSFSGLTLSISTWSQSFDWLIRSYSSSFPSAVSNICPLGSVCYIKKITDTIKITLLVLVQIIV